MNFNEEHKPLLIKGRLLISEPFLGDPNFERTVVLLCEHNEEGSFGFVLNKNTEVNLKDALAEIDEVDNAEGIRLYLGGPVEQNTLHFIHRVGESIEGSIRICEGIYWGGNYEQVKLMIQTGILAEADIRFFIGYSGWGVGQLQGEIEEDTWIIADTTSEMVFDTPSDKLWREVLKSMGGKYRELANYPTDPRLN
jgi:putative transcriptional regulator